MSPTNVQSLRLKIERRIEKALERGCYLRQFQHSTPEDLYSGGCCVLDAVVGDPTHLNFHELAASRLDISEEEAREIEHGFEGWTTDRDNVSAPLYQLGVYLREKYC